MEVYKAVEERHKHVFHLLFRLFFRFHIALNVGERKRGKMNKRVSEKERERGREKERGRVRETERG